MLILCISLSLNCSVFLGSLDTDGIPGGFHANVVGGGVWVIAHTAFQDIAENFTSGK